MSSEDESADEIITLEDVYCSCNDRNTKLDCVDFCNRYKISVDGDQMASLRKLIKSYRKFAFVLLLYISRILLELCIRKLAEIKFLFLNSVKS